MAGGDVSALPLPDNVFKLPKRRPKIVEKAALPDQRKFAVLPIAAAMDKELHGFSMKVLAVLCSYCNRAGITWVGQQRIADHLGVAKQQVARAMKQLRDRGHIEIVSKGFRGEKANTTRVIFAADITTEDAIAVTSGQEDTRPPEIKKAEVKAMTQPETEPEFTPEQMAANRQRLREMLGGVAGRDGSYHFNKPQRIGDLMATRKPRPKKASIDNTQVVQEEASIDNIIDNTGVVQTRNNIGLQEVLGLYEEIIKRRFMVSVKTTENDLKAAEILCEVGVTASDIDLALSEQRNLVDIADHILNARVSR